jgi:hypothetical protein
MARRWTIWQPPYDEEPYDEEIPPSPGPMVMRVYAGPTLKPGERLELVSLSVVEPLVEAVTYATERVCEIEMDGDFEHLKYARIVLVNALKLFADPQ